MMLSVMQSNFLCLSHFVVDFTKAFDSLEWNVMLNTFKHFGFNESFINLVKTLYTDIQTCVMNTMIDFKMGKMLRLTHLNLEIYSISRFL
jgi:hypothetical protein